jgi:hypothetical protein
MERRDRSLEALKSLVRIDSLDPEQRAKHLVFWCNEYIENTPIQNLDLQLPELKQLSELFYKNIEFLKQYKSDIKTQLDSHNKIKKFLQ